MNPLPSTLIGPARGRITRRLAALEQTVFASNANPADGTLTTRTPRGVFVRSRSRGTAISITPQPQIARWL